MKIHHHFNVVTGCVVLVALLLGAPATGSAALLLSDTNKPAQIVRLFFIHHSTGENWLRDDYGGLGIALRDQNYFVSDSNYGWGPDSIGDTTDIGNWYRWFCSPDSVFYMAAVYDSADRNCDYSHLATIPSSANQIVMFKSCFPNSALQGNPEAPIPAIASNPLKNQDSGSEYHTVANAKGIYRELLNYFGAHTNKLFVAITAPPLSDDTWANNARAFNQWLVNDWLKDYPCANVFVFDFYNVLTSNGGSPEVSDAGMSNGHHHRWWQGAVQHQAAGGGNTLAYPSDDDHPNITGSRKATMEFVPLLNAAVRAWQASLRGVSSSPRLGVKQDMTSGLSLTISNLSVGSTYVLQRSPNLAGGAWTNLAVLRAVASTNWAEPAISLTGASFYRVKSQD
jgi:hypothetical protein